MGAGSLPCYSLRIQQAGHNFPDMKAAAHHRRTPWLVAAAIAALAGSPAEAAFRCGSRLIDEGDSPGTVRALCGPPTEVHREHLWRGPLVWHDGRALRLAGESEPVSVEIWIYNLGPNQLMRRIRFEDNQVTALQTLGYGYP